MVNRMLRGEYSARGDRRDKGQASIEFAGVLFILLIAGLAAVQLGLVAYSIQQAGTASRAAARAASQHNAEWEQVGQSSMSDWLAGDTDFDRSFPGTDEVKVEAKVEVPTILPIFSFDPATRNTTMPMD
ncbi:TadE family protein [Streptomyces sp. IB2014 016-6]|uniref:TadE family protein n=1 Tax=Streptomyces sp. IB2014 016-6 TaxID=2517818 RepID=UPI001F4F9B25|nr:TadE family protein [Streptomyces sp. IB2014 016-6]